MPTIAKTVVHNLAANGIQQIWGVPSDSLNAVTEAIRRKKGIEWMLTRHEEAAFPAAGEATLEVCSGSCSPGSMQPIRRRHSGRQGVPAPARSFPSL